MSDAARLLTALQFGDGQFPAGGFAFSWGLESLIADGHMVRTDLAGFLIGQIERRWATLERIVLIHAHAAAGDPDLLSALDDLLDAASVVDTARSGSKRAGQALLATHCRLGTPGAAAFRRAVAAGRAEGHLTVVQGCVLAGAGLDRPATLTLAAYGMLTALTSAGIRLGLVGHLDAQRALAAARLPVAELVERTDADLDALSSFTPLADIALMRHPVQAQRLFST